MPVVYLHRGWVATSAARSRPYVPHEEAKSDSA